MPTELRRRGTVLVANHGAELYGSDRVLLESVSALVEDGWRTIVTVPSGGPLLSELESRGAEIIRCATPMLRKSALRPLGFMRLLIETVVAFFAGWRLLSAVDPHAVYVNTVTIPLWQVLCRLRRIPVLCHVHEGEGSASRTVRFLLALPLQLCHVLVANSQFSVAVIGRPFPRLAKRIAVIYNGVQGPSQPQPAREILEGAVRLTYIGRLSPRKGVDVAIDALALLAASGLEAELDIVGAVFPGMEWYERQLKEQVQQRNLTGSVRFHGFQPSVWDLVSAGDIVVVPSRSDEPFGNTAVEAVLCQRPVIASATSGLLEATGGYTNATTVTPDSPRALAKAIRDVVDHWSSVATAAQTDLQLARSRHGLDTYRTRIQDIVARLASRHR